MAKKLPGYDPRQEMRRADYEIAHKQDTALTGVALHHHDFFEVYFLLSGDVTYIIESRTYHMLPGDMLIINPRELHQVGIQTDSAPYERYVLWISASLMTQLSGDGVDLCHSFDPSDPAYTNQLHLNSAQRNLMQSLMELLQQDSESSDFGSETLPYHLITSIMILVNRIVQQGGNRYPDPEYSNTLVSSVIDYINLHYSENLTLDFLADRFFISKYHLCHMFQQYIGTGIYQYTQQKRLMIARQLMRQGKKPTTIFSQCGFEDYAGFYRAFRQVYGMSPRAFMQSLHSGSFK